MFLPEPDLGDNKTVNGETYLNLWINYTLHKPIRVSSVVFTRVTTINSSSIAQLLTGYQMSDPIVWHDARCLHSYVCVVYNTTESATFTADWDVELVEVFFSMTDIPALYISPRQFPVMPSLFAIHWQLCAQFPSLMILHRPHFTHTLMSSALIDLFRNTLPYIHFFVHVQAKWVIRVFLCVAVTEVTSHCAVAK